MYAKAIDPQAAAPVAMELDVLGGIEKKPLAMR